MTSASAGGATFALKPVPETETGYFVFRGQPGRTVRGAVQVLNVGSAAGRASLYTVDATTGQTSGAVYRSRQESRRSVGSWVRLGKSTVELAPGQSQVVPFSVRVPAGKAAGQYLGAIVTRRSRAQTTRKPAAPDKTGGFKVRIQELSVLAVQVNVPGAERAKMKLTGIKVGHQPGHQSVLLGIGNAGNVLVKGRGSLKIVHRGGKLAQHRSFNLDTFVPHTRIDFPVYIQGKALQPGRYLGTVSIVYRGDRLTRTFPFTITAADAAQVFGTQASHGIPPGSSGNNTLLYILTIVSILSLSAAFFFFWRSRHPA